MQTWQKFSSYFYYKLKQQNEHAIAVSTFTWHQQTKLHFCTQTTNCSHTITVVKVVQHSHCTHSQPDSTDIHNTQSGQVDIIHGTGTPKETTKSSRCWMRTSLMALLNFSDALDICTKKSSEEPVKWIHYMLHEYRREKYSHPKWKKNNMWVYFLFLLDSHDLENVSQSLKLVWTTSTSKARQRLSSCQFERSDSTSAQKHQC